MRILNAAVKKKTDQDQASEDKTEEGASSLHYGRDGEGSIDLQTSKAKKGEMTHDEVSSRKSSFKSSIKKRKLKKKRIPPADKDEVLNRNNIALEKSLPNQKIVMAHPQLTYHEQQIIEKHGPGPYRQYLFDQVGNFDQSSLS